MQNLLVISSLLQCKIHSKNNFSQILGSLGGIQYSDLILTGTCNAAAAGSVAVTGDSDGEWVMGGGRRVMVVVAVYIVQNTGSGAQCPRARRCRRFCCCCFCCCRHSFCCCMGGGDARWEMGSGQRAGGGGGGSRLHCTE